LSGGLGGPLLCFAVEVLQVVHGVVKRRTKTIVKNIPSGGFVLVVTG
jgi:hypothetical protein